ncbi:unnamed protein product [Dovyalis caffra]|uniref:RRM domain-containing protein n=1 Tax=Dovyalis caffra TaxID=77055 RepID=A0AAV1RE19_9ROSI|nr:unnamed protein product [Dovyalis caffra]
MAVADEHIDFGDDDDKMQYQASAGAIPALAEEEIGEDDEYDDLYNDVNVGENFLQMHASHVPATIDNGGYQAPNPKESIRVETGGSQRSALEGNAGPNFPEQKELPIAVGSVGYPDGSSIPHKGRNAEMTHDTRLPNMGFQGPTIAAAYYWSCSPQVVPHMPVNRTSMNADVNRPMMNENQIRPPIDNGSATLFVGELHWWTTDAELESVLSQYGRVKEIKFFEERASGKSKGYCQVEFYDPAAAAACKEGMNGHLFNGRPCVVAFASPQTLKQMGASYVNKAQAQPQSQSQTHGRRPMNEGAGRGSNMNYQSGDGGRNYGRGGWGRGGQGIGNRGGGPTRGRGGMGPKNMAGGYAGVGNSANGGGYGQGLAGPPFSAPAGGMIPPQGMMSAGFDPLYMGRGGGYGAFPGHGFPGMLPSFPAVNSMGLPGVAPHVNPAFFGRGMAPNGMGMMVSSGMDGPNPGMWSDTSAGGWGEEHDRRTRESSYDGDDGASEHGYGDANHENVVRPSGASREKERGSEREWSGNSDRKYREEREQDWDSSEREHREHRHRDEKDSYRGHRQRERNSGYEDDGDRGQSSSRSHSRSRAAREEDHRSRSRDVDHGKRRRS